MADKGVAFDPRGATRCRGATGAIAHRPLGSVLQLPGIGVATPSPPCLGTRSTPSQTRFFRWKTRASTIHRLLTAPTNRR